MPSTALKEHEYEIAELVIADKWHERQLMANMKWIKKKNKNQRRSKKLQISTHEVHTRELRRDYNKEYGRVNIYGKSQHSSMRSKATSQMITAFWRSDMM